MDKTRNIDLILLIQKALRPEGVNYVDCPCNYSVCPDTMSWMSAEKGALNDFCVDITAQAAEGKIDPVIGRDKEVERVVQILARRTKNNPILLGEPGVGKTAIAEGLAMRISGGDVPEFLVVRTPTNHQQYCACWVL